jgi:plastocyanin
MRRGAFLAVCAVVLLAAPRAHAQKPLLPLPEIGSIAPLAAEVQHLHYAYGPVHVPVGGNLILLGPVTIEKPAYDGYVTRFAPNLVRADGSVPPVDVIHLHHGVWLNASGTDATAGGGERMAAAGEEKTVVQFPPGYGYPVKGSDFWIMNHMIHNQTAVPENVWITYDVDFVPAKSALGQRMKPARPVWMDVQNGSAYPVFDVKRGSGGDGKLTYPDEVPGAPRKNEWTVDRDGTLISAFGHVHPGGLYTDLDVVRGGRTQRLFRSEAKYWDPNGPVSWDMAMTATRPSWRAGLRKGDRLRASATYETERASWYESMGIVVAFMADDRTGPDPFVTPPDATGEVTHGHLPENDNHGGAEAGLPDARTLPDQATVDNRVGIAGFNYLPGGLGLTGFFGNPATVTRGTPLTFNNLEWGAQIFHTITACKAPCNRTTGISYPLADGDIDFDSGELGYGPPGFTAAANRDAWTAPADLATGTYTYFCRIHPFMRGAFRVK